ncbi:MAG TPA: hypothetical protein VIV60_05770 [Polyangiaceae bacterium]
MPRSVTPRVVIFVLGCLDWGCSNEAPGSSAADGGANSIAGASAGGASTAMGGEAAVGGSRTTEDSTLAGSAVVSTIRHGAELTQGMVGPVGLGVATDQLRKTAVGDERISTWSTDGIPSWIPNSTYIYSNDPTNHGGVVEAGGMTIDGFAIPGGAWVAQFDDFGNESIIISGDNKGTTKPLPGIVFRGCRWRGQSTAPGYLNVYAGSHTNIWVLFSDAGGLGAADKEYNEVPFSTNDDTSNVLFYRNYISYTTTGIQPGTVGPQIIENFVEHITYYYGEAGPPNESGPKHLNGISLNGGQENALILRNKVLLQSPDDAGRSVAQTDAIALFQDGGSFPGIGTNVDGSTGYQILDNYVGGGGYCIYAGLNAGKSASTVKNLVLAGNRVTTQWWPNGGSYGPLTAHPVWGSNGNVKRDNSFAETGAAW